MFELIIRIASHWSFNTTVIEFEIERKSDLHVWMIFRVSLGNEPRINLFDDLIFTFRPTKKIDLSTSQTAKWSVLAV